MLSYDESTDQYSVSVRLGNFVLPPGVQLQFKMDTIGYFIAYVEDNMIMRIPLTDAEYREISEEYDNL
jgi:hypothetical protein